MILYFRKYFQNLAAHQKQNRAAPYHTTSVGQILRNMAHFTKEKLPEKSEVLTLFRGLWFTLVSKFPAKQA